MERGIARSIWSLVTESFDTLCVAIEIGLPADDSASCDHRNSQPAVTAVEELQRLAENTSVVPPFPLRFVAIEHPGRITSNGLGTMEVGHAADPFQELPSVTGARTGS